MPYCIGCPDVLLAPCEEDGYVQDDGQNDVHYHASCHDYESLPGRTRAELPGLGRLFHGFGVHGLVYHAGYLAEASEGYAAYAELSVTAFWLELEYGRGKEKIEFLHPYPEYSGGDIVPELMYQNQKGQRQYDLYDF